MMLSSRCAHVGGGELLGCIFEQYPGDLCGRGTAGMRDPLDYVAGLGINAGCDAFPAGPLSLIHLRNLQGLNAANESD
jgi:hypothetical protein